jgi:hypothetical protein
MRTITPFDPSITAGGTFDPLVVNKCGRIVLYNESPAGLQLQFTGGSTATLPPYFFRSYYVATPGLVQWTRTYSIQSGGSPLSQVVGDAYEPAEATHHTFTEGPLNRQLNIGNPLTLSSSATSVQNDGNIAATSVVEATQISGPASNIEILNDGSFKANEYIAGILTQLFRIIPGNATPIQLAAADRLTQVLGGLQVIQGAHVNGALTVDSTINSGTVTSPNIVLSSGGWSRNAKQIANLGTGDNVYSHNLGWQPDGVFAFCTDGSAIAIGWRSPSINQIRFIQNSGATHQFDLLFFKIVG